MRRMFLAAAGAAIVSVAGATSHSETAAAKEVTAAMEALKQAMIKKDGAALEKLCADDLTYSHSAGQLETKAQFIQSVSSGKSIVERLDFIDPVIRIYGNTALYRSGVNLYHSKTDIVNMNTLHVWVKQPTGWKMVARQATRLTPPAK